MAKQSAGILLYKIYNGKPEFLIVHPGGPFWTKKDKGAWSIPKGEFDDAEDPQKVARREFKEELGHEIPGSGFIELGQVKLKSGKTVHAWAVEGDLITGSIKSNTFQMEWPPKSGKTQEFPEVDRAGWFSPAKAKEKLNPTQAEFIDRLMEIKGFEQDKLKEQMTLI